MGSSKTSWFNNIFFPKVSAKAYISPTATVAGRVTIAPDVLVAPGVSIRADEGDNIFIGPESNVQDNVIMHGLLHKTVQVGDEQFAIYIAERVSCAHGSIIHGPTFIGSNTFIGFGAIVHNSCIGKNCFMGHGAKIIAVNIADGKFVPYGAIIESQEQANQLGPVPEQLLGFNHDVVQVNIELARGYKQL